MQEQSKKSLTISIPAFNEEETIEKVAKDALKVASKLSRDYEVLLVDDGSRDKTRSIMRRLAEYNQHIRVIEHKKNKGFSGAIKTSLKRAKKELIFLGPADGQFDYQQIKNFIEGQKKTHANIVLGLRVQNYESKRRKFQSYIFHLISRILLGIKEKDIKNVSLWEKGVLDKFESKVDERSDMILPELIYTSLKKGFKIARVPIKWEKRKSGQAKGEIRTGLIARTLFQMFKFSLTKRIIPNLRKLY